MPRISQMLTYVFFFHCILTVSTAIIHRDCKPHVFQLIIFVCNNNNNNSDNLFCCSPRPLMHFHCRGDCRSQVVECRSVSSCVISQRLPAVTLPHVVRVICYSEYPSCVRSLLTVLCFRIRC